MNFVDQLISEIDKGIKFSLDNYQKENRQYPAADINDDNLSEFDRNNSANLMRVNHSGEVAAQGLYRGQALTAPSPSHHPGPGSLRTSSSTGEA